MDLYLASGHPLFDLILIYHKILHNLVLKSIFFYFYILIIFSSLYILVLLCFIDKFLRGVCFAEFILFKAENR